MHHLMSMSGGKASFYAAWLVIKRHAAELIDGTDRLTLLFADTKIEDEDLYRFLDDAYATLSARLPSGSIELVTLTEGRNPWEVFEDVRFIGNTMIDPCSRILKRETLRAALESAATPPAADGSEGEIDPSLVRVYVGIDWTEEHRMGPIASLHEPFECLSPLLEPDYYTALTSKPPEARHFLELMSRLGIREPRLYTMGFSHNNCGGFCIKGGQSAFAKLLYFFPERYMEHEEREENMRRHVLGTPEDPSPATIMRDRSKRTRAESVGLNADDDGDVLPFLNDSGAKVSGRYVAGRSTPHIEEGEEIPRAVPLSMRELRLRIQAAEDAGLDPIEARVYDPGDVGACSCFAPVPAGVE